MYFEIWNTNQYPVIPHGRADAYTHTAGIACTFVFILAVDVHENKQIDSMCCINCPIQFKWKLRVWNGWLKDSLVLAYFTRAMLWLEQTHVRNNMSCVRWSETIRRFKSKFNYYKRIDVGFRMQSTYQIYWAKTKNGTKEKKTEKERERERTKCWPTHAIHTQSIQSIQFKTIT